MEWRSTKCWREMQKKHTSGEHSKNITPPRVLHAHGPSSGLRALLPVAITPSLSFPSLLPGIKIYFYMWKKSHHLYSHNGSSSCMSKWTDQLFVIRPMTLIT